MNWPLQLAERGWVPDPLLRRGIRRLLSARLAELETSGRSDADLASEMRSSPLAIETDAANEQHYEVPPEFFQKVLGRHLKYSGCWWPPSTTGGATGLDEAEAATLDLTCSRAEIEDGMVILDLGCGWGSLSLWMAEKYPKSHVTSVSNSAPQGEFIRRTAAERGLDNIEVLTADMNDLRMNRAFDRIVSIEMFEHMRNYEILFDKIDGWLKPDGKLFVHVFCHRSHSYFFEDRGAGDWMARHFFTGGLMPSEQLMDQFAGALQVEQRWRVGGEHYEKTALAWLDNLDRRRPEIMPTLQAVYGKDADRWFHRWRIFFLACAELFGYRGGDEWFVSHALWRRGDD